MSTKFKKLKFFPNDIEKCFPAIFITRISIYIQNLYLSKKENILDKL